VVDHFSRRCRAVRLIPFDPHLEEGAEISLGLLRRGTREALTELAAVVADGFPGERNPGVA
jgi:MinD-like ATPase involved in chromosome partitioning or flagellar assembly